MRRLDFAPDTKDMEVTDITNGRFVFKPQPDKPVSLTALRKAVTKAGYEIEGTWIEVTGILTANELRVPETGQIFQLLGEEGLAALREQAAAGKVTAAGPWKVDGKRESIVLEEPRAKAGAKEGHP